MKTNKKILISIGSILILIPLLFFSYTFVFSTPEKNDKTSGFSAEPANKNSINPLQFSYSLKAGDQVEDEVLITNNTDSDLKFYVKFRDTEKVNGVTQVNEDANKQNYFGKWASPEKEDILVKANSSETYKFQIKIPQDTEKKDYTGSVLVGSVAQPNSTGIINNYRIRLTSNINVTDTPKHLEKIVKPSFPTLSLPKIYFLASVIIFTIGFGYTIIRIITKKEETTKEHQHKK